MYFSSFQHKRIKIKFGEESIENIEADIMKGLPLIAEESAEEKKSGEGVTVEDYQTLLQSLLNKQVQSETAAINNTIDRIKLNNVDLNPSVVLQELKTEQLENHGIDTGDIDCLHAIHDTSVIADHMYAVNRTGRDQKHQRLKTIWCKKKKRERHEVISQSVLR